jgi:hypothetical protein
MTEKYQRNVSSHVIAQTAPICPSTLHLDIAMDALLNLVGGSKRSGLQSELRGMDNHAPMCMGCLKTSLMQCPGRCVSSASLYRARLLAGRFLAGRYSSGVL